MNLELLREYLGVIASAAEVCRDSKNPVMRLFALGIIEKNTRAALELLREENPDQRQAPNQPPHP